MLRTLTRGACFLGRSEGQGQSRVRGFRAYAPMAQKGKHALSFIQSFIFISESSAIHFHCMAPLLTYYGGHFFLRH